MDQKGQTCDVLFEDKLEGWHEGRLIVDEQFGGLDKFDESAKGLKEIVIEMRVGRIRDLGFEQFDGVVHHLSADGDQSSLAKARNLHDRCERRTKGSEKRDTESEKRDPERRDRERERRECKLLMMYSLWSCFLFSKTANRWAMTRGAMP